MRLVKQFCRSLQMLRVSEYCFIVPLILASLWTGSPTAGAQNAGIANGTQKRVIQELPPLGPPERIEPGIIRCEVKLQRGDKTSLLWVYLPEMQPATKIPCVVIAPAGTRLFHGTVLDKGSMPEHLPYVRAGFAVVAYELDGNISDQPVPGEVFAAAKAFHDADAGLVNARAAIDYIEARLPWVDAGRIYAAGHSSAGTMALLLAEHEPRIKACAAFAPICDLEARLEKAIPLLSKPIPDFPAFVHRSSPAVGIRNLRCPTFLFHADDDSNVPTEEVALFAAELHKTNDHVTFVRVPTGNHYESMIKEGVPQAIQWFQKLPSTHP